MKRNGNPADLWFTHDAIASHFKAPQENFSLQEAVEKIQIGKMSPNSFPKIWVISHNGCMWSIDNWQTLGLPNGEVLNVTIIICTPSHRMRSSPTHWDSRDFQNWCIVLPQLDVDPQSKGILPETMNFAYFANDPSLWYHQDKSNLWGLIKP